MSGGPFLHHPFRPKRALARVRTASSVCNDVNSKVQRDPSTLVDGGACQHSLLQSPT
jgi:hypothetical protein